MGETMTRRSVRVGRVQERRLRVVPSGPGVSRTARQSEEPMRIRINRRGRLVLRVGLGAVLLVIVTAVVLIWPRPSSAGQGGTPMQVRYHVVLPGETLWGLAATVERHGDLRDVVAELISLNALQSPGLHVGQRVALPVS